MLKTSKEFDFVYKNSYKFRTEMLDICVLRANLASEFFAKFRRLPCDLVGFSVSKKVGNAVSRNLVKRRLRAICREFFSLGNSSLRAQFIARGNPPCNFFIDSAIPSPLISLDSFSQKGCTPLPAPPTRQKLRFSLLGGEPRFSASSKKSAGGTSAPFDSDFLHHEAGEIKGASHGFILDSANSQNLVKKPCHSERSEESKKNNLVILNEAKYLKDKNRDSSVALLPQNDKNSVQVAESSLDSADSQNLQGGLPRSHSLARNDEFLDSSPMAQNNNNVDCHNFASAKSRNDGVRRNLICIFIAKSQILQTPFATLKGIIFDALKKQLDFRQDLHKRPRMSRPRITHYRTNQNRAFQNPNYNPNKGAL